MRTTACQLAHRCPPETPFSAPSPAPGARANSSHQSASCSPSSHVGALMLPLFPTAVWKTDDPHVNNQRLQKRQLLDLRREGYREVAKPLEPCEHARFLDPLPPSLLPSLHLSRCSVRVGSLTMRLVALSPPLLPQTLLSSWCSRSPPSSWRRTIARRTKTPHFLVPTRTPATTCVRWCCRCGRSPPR